MLAVFYDGFQLREVKQNQVNVRRQPNEPIKTRSAGKLLDPETRAVTMRPPRLPRLVLIEQQRGP